MTSRHFPPPWTVIEHAESRWVQDAGGQTVRRFYFRHNDRTKPGGGGELRAE
jgi:hypothetical protein